MNLIYPTLPPHELPDTVDVAFNLTVLYTNPRIAYACSPVYDYLKGKTRATLIEVGPSLAAFKQCEFLIGALPTTGFCGLMHLVLSGAPDLQLFGQDYRRSYCQEYMDIVNKYRVDTGRPTIDLSIPLAGYDNGHAPAREQKVIDTLVDIGRIHVHDTGAVSHP